MKKYFYVFWFTAREKFRSPAEMAFEALMYFCIIFCILSVWTVVFSGSNELCGYSLQQIMWYIVFSEALWFSGQNKPFTDEISYNTKSGKIACDLGKPYDYVAFSFARYLGQIFAKFLVFIVLVPLILIPFLGPLLRTGPLEIFSSLVVFIFSMLISAIIRIALSLSSFFIEENRPLHWIFDKIMLMFGVMFPQAMLPAWLRPFVCFTPIFATISGPVGLTVGFSLQAFLTVVLQQILWFVGVFVVAHWLFEKGARRLDVNGG